MTNQMLKQCFKDCLLAVTITVFFVLVFLALSNVVHAQPVQPADAVVRIAQSEIGRGEIGWDNFGPDVLKYTKGKPVSWCAGFVSYVMTQAGTDFEYTLSAREIYNRAKNRGMVTTAPMAGDLIVFWRGEPNGWQGHVGIVEEVKGTKITTIEGNVGDYPAKVRRFEYEKNNIPRLLGFVRVEQYERLAWQR